MGVTIPKFQPFWINSPPAALHQGARWRSPHSCSAAPAVPLPSAALHPGGDWALGGDIGMEENGG